MDFYCEINEQGICYHVTTNELPLSERIIKCDKPQLGKKWTGSEWVDVPEEGAAE